MSADELELAKRRGLRDYCLTGLEKAAKGWRMKPDPSGHSRSSIDEQLRAGGIREGTKLEQLVRDNQNFELLYPRESEDDTIGLPLWLRVYWRKHHPEHSCLPEDPTGGYPRALRKLHEWMVRNQKLPGVDYPSQQSGSGKRLKSQDGKAGES
jgi:hypothetical protein